MLRLDLNSLNTKEGRPFVKMSANMEYVDLTDDDSLSDKMKFNLPMFNALMLNGIGGEVHNADVVTVDECTEKTDSRAHGAADTARWPQPRRW
jgi:hypothetical protein